MKIRTKGTSPKRFKRIDREARHALLVVGLVVAALLLVMLGLLGPEYFSTR